MCLLLLIVSIHTDSNAEQFDGGEFWERNFCRLNGIDFTFVFLPLIYMAAVRQRAALEKCLEWVSFMGLQE